MIEINNTQVYGLEKSILASSLSFKKGKGSVSRDMEEKDWNRAYKLGSAEPGYGHDGYLKGVIVQADITFPQYWSLQAQRYHFFEIVMSSSKMHSLCKNALLPFEEFKMQFNKYVDDDSIKKIQKYALDYNSSSQEDKYECFMKMQSNLPMGFELTMSITTNYLQLKTMFLQRKNHLLKEDWGNFCNWCMSLPHFKELTGVDL